jgi:hypothetical protein
MSFTRVVRSSAQMLLIVGSLALSLTGCSAKSNGVLVSRTPQVTVTAGRSTLPLPSTIPLPGHAALIQEYSATLNSKTGVTWFYTVVGSDQTPASVIAFYQTNMPTNGWTVVAVPPESATGKYGGTAIAYQQGSEYATIATGLDSQYPRAVVLLITVAPYSG